MPYLAQSSQTRHYGLAVLPHVRKRTKIYTAKDSLAVYHTPPHQCGSNIQVHITAAIAVVGLVPLPPQARRVMIFIMASRIQLRKNDNGRVTRK